MAQLPTPAQMTGSGVTEQQFKDQLTILLDNVAGKNDLENLKKSVFSKTGKNLFNKEEIVAGEQYSPSVLKIIVSSVYRRSGFVPVTAGKTYTLSGNNVGSSHIAWY